MDSLSFTLHELEAQGSTRSYNALMAPAEGVWTACRFLLTLLLVQEHDWRHDDSDDSI
jgi:hypothetical protein